MVSLLVGIRYYIQNVDSGTFLELPDKLTESEVKTRPVKFSEKQLWTIVADQREPDVFLLENVAQKTWLGVVTEGNRFSQLVGHSRANACKCLNGTVFISLSEPAPDSDTVEPRARYTNVLAYAASKEDSEESVKSQKWFITRSNDGTYSIQDTEQHLFLGCEAYDCYKYGPIHGLREAFAWDITPVGGGFAYTINVRSLSDLLSIGFRDYQAGVGKELALMPAMSAHSQTWFFEPWDDSEVPTSSESPLASSGKKDSKAKKAASRSGNPGPGMTPSSSNLAGSATSGFPGPGFTNEETMEGIGPRVSGGAESDSDNEDDGGQSKVIPDGHYHIRNVGSGKCLNVATTTYFRSEPSHAPSRFLVRVSESNEVQIIPHSYVGLQSLVWRDSKIAVEDAQESAWQLIKDDDVEEERRFQLRPIGAADGHVLKVEGSEIKLMGVEAPEKGSYRKWDFVTIY
ncbi:hypothetical protein H1R20_g10937, partial [Candolleomyces eurysporus]